MPPFTGANDPNRMTGGHKGIKSVRKYFEEFATKTPQEFYSLVGDGIVPKQYAKNKNMMQAGVAIIWGILLGHLKGDKLRAANLIFDRLEGKPAQKLEIGSTLTQADLDAMTDEELKKIADGKTEIAEAE